MVVRRVTSNDPGVGRTAAPVALASRQDHQPFPAPRGHPPLAPGQRRLIAPPLPEEPQIKERWTRPARELDSPLQPTVLLAVAPGSIASSCPTYWLETRCPLPCWRVPGGAHTENGGGSSKVRVSYGPWPPRWRCTRGKSRAYASVRAISSGGSASSAASPSCRAWSKAARAAAEAASDAGCCSSRGALPGASLSRSTAG